MATDFYSVLGVAPTAKPDTIKKRYRELARKHHPDVNPGADAANKIKLINEAYHILGDADRRATYDAERFLQQAAQPERPSATPTNAPRPNRPSAPTGTGSASGRTADNRTTPRPPDGFDFNGFGRVPPQNGAQARPTGARPNAAAPPRTPKAEYQVRPTPALAQLLAEAQLAYINRKYGDAEKLCRKALDVDKRNAVAHEILGDIYLKRGERIQANTAYAYAIQFNPHNQSVLAKLDRLAGGPAHRPDPGPTMTHAAPGVPLRQQFFDGPNRERSLLAVSLMSVALLVGEFFFIATNPGEPFVAGLSLNVLGAMAVAGTLGGILLALYGAMRPLSQVLAPRQNASTPVGLSVVLTLFALLWFYASFVVYLIIGTVQNRTSFSVLRAYGMTVVLTLLFAWLYAPAGTHSSALYTLLFGGNVLFPMVLLGWKIGDGMRLGRT